MSRERWLGVALAVGFIVGVELLVDSVLDATVRFPLNVVLVALAVAVVATISAWLAFSRMDRLDQHLRERNDALESRTAALRAVHDVSLSVAAQADPQETIGTIVYHVRRLLRVDAAILALVAPDGRLTLRAFSAVDGVMSVLPAADAATSYDELSCFVVEACRILATSPVGHGEKRVGTLAVACRMPRDLDDSDMEILSGLATHVGLALEAARLRDQLKDLAVQDERERIARDMHDGLAQVLGYVNTKSQAVAHLLDEGRIDEAHKQLAELSAAARSVYVDVREAILNLSTPAGEHDIATALREYADRYAESSKLAVRFKASTEAVKAPLSAATQAEVFSIAREALTNVRKHARAHRVSIEMLRSSGEVVVLIKDDGVGFESDLLGTGPERWPHFGLAGMRERAESVGGRVAWHSHLGEGTEVELRVPVGRADKGRATEDSKPLHGTDRPTPRHQAVRSVTRTG